MVLIIIGVVIILLFIYVVVLYNGLITLNNKVDEAFATMDVYLKKRYDLVPNIVATVKGYAEHESATLEQVTKLRSMSMNSSDQLAAEEKITAAIGKIMVAVESYPDLKANKGFLNLQTELHDIEQDIAMARKYYNGSVRQMNDKVQMFPSNIIASMFHFQKRRMFEVESDEQRKRVDISL